jgi:hypothetical protein
MPVVREWQVSIWDVLILQAAEASGCRCLLSEDLADGMMYGSIVAANPFAQRRKPQAFVGLDAARRAGVAGIGT